MNLGFGELLLIFIVIVLIFGSSKLPALGDALGRGIRNFRKSVDSLREPSGQTKDEPRLPPPPGPK